MDTGSEGKDEKVGRKLEGKVPSWRKRLMMGYILPVIGVVVLWLICKSVRIEKVDDHYEKDVESEREGFIYSFWHGRIFYFAHFYRWRGINVLISRSQDGELIARVIRMLGYRTSRGSTTGGGGSRALASMARYMQDTLLSTSICPDGPRGPRYRATKGIIFLASITGRPILPMTNSFRRMRVFRSWDRFILPYPFTRGVVIYAEPVRVPPGASEEVMEAKTRELERKLNTISYRADNYFSKWSDHTLTNQPVESGSEDDL